MSTEDRARAAWLRVRRAALIAAVASDDLVGEIEITALTNDVPSGETFSRLDAAVSRLRRLAATAPRPATGDS